MKLTDDQHINSARAFVIGLAAEQCAAELPTWKLS